MMRGAGGGRGGVVISAQTTVVGVDPRSVLVGDHAVLVDLEGGAPVLHGEFNADGDGVGVDRPWWIGDGDESHGASTVVIGGLTIRPHSATGLGAQNGFSRSVLRPIA